MVNFPKKSLSFRVIFILFVCFIFLSSYILNYLRDGELRCSDDKAIRKDLLAEAKFYQIQGIVIQLEEQSSFESSSIIKNETHQSAVQSWLPPNATCSLLYRASTDGNTPADFHRCCDNKGPTLVVIESGEYIFGGYTSQSWESPESMQLIHNLYSIMIILIRALIAILSVLRRKAVNHKDALKVNNHLAPVVQRLDNTIHRINHYPEDK